MGKWEPSKTRTFPLQAWVIFYFHDYGRTGTISHKEDPTCDILWQSFCCNRTTHLWEQLSDPSNLLVHPVWSFCVLLERLTSLSFWKSRMTLKHLETLCDMVFLHYNCLNSHWDKPPFSSYPTFFVHTVCVCVFVNRFPFAPSWQYGYAHCVAHLMLFVDSKRLRDQEIPFVWNFQTKSLLWNDTVERYIYIYTHVTPLLGLDVHLRSNIKAR